MKKVKSIISIIFSIIVIMLFISELIDVNNDSSIYITVYKLNQKGNWFFYQNIEQYIAYDILIILVSLISTILNMTYLLYKKCFKVSLFFELLLLIMLGYNYYYVFSIL